MAPATDAPRAQAAGPHANTDEEEWRVLGIDPGTASTGYGIVVETCTGDFALLAYGVISTMPAQPMPLRLREIFNDIRNLIDEFEPHEVAIEELFFGRNVTNAISVGQARGAALLAAALSDRPVVEYTPAAVKQALTGYGNADKQQMQAMVRTLLELDEAPRPDDAADGVAIALCHLQTGRYRRAIGES
ncbi:MAG: crossover junction endodeoxyribonuclease RuvC [Caldilineaceae bacterium]|nr:crossover junction endodeoxyribonuclease RuvC [Caldilineaceae bacterium]MCY4093283.1 crossover junction endodeoxyribonuclease RuvC [Caldilineaceae bacterium]MCY4116027.1 crossover junction endodeoxyribonuclease RuvC [Caldilineaceae bacterium]MDE0180419.1 crossover junction endodeoxyribonuclease RuvC [Caldilineaceae bacterium]